MPIVFPEPTHCKGGRQDMFSRLEKWKPVKDVLDFSDEGTTIFREKPLAEKTLERIYAGLIKFVAGGKDAFLSVTIRFALKTHASQLMNHAEC